MIIRTKGLGILSEDELKMLLVRQVNLPGICKFYNSENGCSRPTGKPCMALHVCSQYLTGKCNNKPCPQNHNVLDEQPRDILKGLGWNVERDKRSILKDLQRRYKQNDASIPSGQQHPADRY